MADLIPDEESLNFKNVFVLSRKHSSILSVTVMPSTADGAKLVAGQKIPNAKFSFGFKRCLN